MCGIWLAFGVSSYICSKNLTEKKMFDFAFDVVKSQLVKCI